MVSDRLAGRPGAPRDRAQLILVGAIAIALILLGLAVVLNSAMLTTIAGTQGTTESIKESSSVDHELSEGVGATAHAANFETKHDDRDELEDSVAENVSELNRPLQRRTVEGSGALVSIEETNVTTNGTRVVQDEVSDFTATTGYLYDEEDWYPVGNVSGPGNETQVGWFDVVIDTGQSADDTLLVTVEYADEYGGDDERTISIDVNGDRVDLSGDGMEAPCSAEADDGAVTLLIGEGTVANNDTACSIDLVDPDGEQRIRFHGDTATVEGTYNVTVDEGQADVTGNSKYLGVAPVASGDEPHLAWIAWSVGVEYVYDVDEVTAESDHREVDVYD